ncbi:MAG: mismatch repair protein MutS2 [Gaiellales bacterium]|jgi:DNA mismatch repair protein MutS2|nr:mismatch repair protein MutS2 [Gaiellales bacterium]
MDGHALDVLELAAIRERLANHTSFSASRALAEALLPSPDAGEVGTRQALCAEALGLLALGPPHMAGAHDVRAEAEHAGRGGALGVDALVEIAETVRAALGVRAHLAEREETAPLLAGRASGIAEALAVVADQLERALELDPPGVRDSASPRLKTLRSELATARRRASDRLRSLASDPDLQPHLQEDFVTERGGRPVIAVRASARSAVPGIVHDTSNSGQTLFVEPFAIVELSNRLRELEGEERDEVARILAELSRHVGTYADELADAVEALASIDLALARGALSRGWRGCPVALGDDVELIAARHPLLDPASVVPIDLPLAGVRVLVLSGANTGGKTVALKTLGLCALLHQCGLQPPAERARLPVFADVLADIGDEQSIAASLSTFSGHVRNLVHVLEAATPRTLVLLDEVAAGTDPIEGAALARALLGELAERAALTVTTTHYAEVKQWASVTPGALNGAVGFDEETLAPTYTLTLGRPGPSHALEIARRLGLDERVIGRARQGLAPERVETERLLSEAARSEQAALRLRAEADAERGEASALREQAARHEQAQRAAAVAAQEAISDERERARGEAQRDLAAYLGELEALREELRAARREERRRREAPSAEERAAEAERDRRLGAADAHARAAGRAIDEGLDVRVRQTRALEPGDPVRARALGLRGVIDEIVDGVALVQGGAMRVHVPVEQLEPDPEGARSSRDAEPPVRVRAAAMSHAPSLLDLRGQRADEAREAVRRLVDDAYLAGLPEVEIVHGRGTGAVRSAVRAELDRHPLVERHVSESADGATRVTLASRGS